MLAVLLDAINERAIRKKTSFERRHDYSWMQDDRPVFSDLHEIAAMFWIADSAETGASPVVELQDRKISVVHGCKDT